jgi:prevent-host-death family protein
MNSKKMGIEEARKALGDLVTAAQQGTDIVITRNGKPAARLIRYQEDPMVNIYELAAQVQMANAPEKVARFAGCFTEHDPRTGRLPLPGQGQGMDATFTREEADRLAAEWDRHARNAEGLEYLAPGDPEFTEVAERYRP